MKLASSCPSIASLATVVGILAGALLGGCASSDGTNDPANGAAEETPPATTAEELRAGCRWQREPGQCPVAKPGGGALPLCYPAVYGDAHWVRICGGAHACPAGEVWNGSGCIPGF